jgi:hypothetical protein
VRKEPSTYAPALNLKLPIERYFLALIFLVAPIPLFFDFSVFDFYINKPVDLHELFRIHLGIPVPLALFCYIFYQAYGWLQIQVKSNDFRYLLLHRRNFNLMILALGIYLLLFGMNLPKLIQITLPLLLLVNMVIPNNLDTRSIIIKNYSIGIALFSAIHLLSIYLQNNQSFTSVDRYMNFGTIFSYQIYQSLVTYINVLSLFSLLFLHELISNPRNHFIKLIIMIALIILAGFGGSRMLLADMATLLLVAMTYLVLYKPKYFFAFFIIPVLAFIFDFHPFGESLNKLKLEGTQNRTDLWLISFDQIYPKLDEFLFFGDGTLTYVAHNFFINLINGVGLLPMIIITILIMVILRNIVIYSPNSQSTIFMFGAYTMLLLNSFFNTSFTQPLYMSNFLIITGLIISPMPNSYVYSEKT